MSKIEVFSADCFDFVTNAALTDYLRKCEWGAGQFLSQLLENRSFFIEGDRVLFLTENGKVFSFLTLSQQDCVDDPSMTPWIGFVYTDPRQRGHRYAGKLITRALDIARERGANRVYIATDHIGLYEKYGFNYICDKDDINGETSRIYCYELLA